MGESTATLSVVAKAASSAVAGEATIKFPKLSERHTEELVIALVGPVGSGCSATYRLLEEILKNDYGYAVHYYKLSDSISQNAKLVGMAIDGNEDEAARVRNLQKIGDKLRAACGKSYLAAKAVEKIAERREIDGFGQTASGQAVPKKIRQVHIIDSIKHPEELKLLRSTYGEIFWLIGVFAPLAIRERRLEFQQHLDRAQIGEIIDRDYTEEEDHGQKVRDVFYQADFFVRNDQENTVRLKQTLERFLEVLFGGLVHTPTLDESSMYAAYAEAAKSACLSRQVGVAVVSPSGELIGLGRNDVPKVGGSLYSEDDGEHDHRCYAWQDKRCHNDKKKDGLYQQIYDRLSTKGLLSNGVSAEDVKKEIKATDVRSLIEYSRAVHAEMDAIISVARTHKAGLLGGTLYSTTFPCHSCARHIVASGIARVLFIEPYPKSLATELHSDAVSENEADAASKVLFLQFSGIAPKNILKLFKLSSARLTRKSDDGKLQKFDKKAAAPVVAVSLDDYSTHEKWVIAELMENEQKASAGNQPALFPS
jgi:deoxycytidylate deaminase